MPAGAPGRRDHVDVVCARQRLAVGVTQTAAKAVDSIEDSVVEIPRHCT